MPPVNAVYYPSWHVYKGRTPAQIPTDTITHIYYAFIRYIPSPLSTSHPYSFKD